MKIKKKYLERPIVKKKEERDITLSRNPPANKYIASTKKIAELRTELAHNLKKGNLIEATKLYIALSKTQKPTDTLKTKLSLIEIQLHNLEISKKKREAIEKDKSINAKQKELYLRLTSKQIEKKENALITEIKKRIDLQIKN